MKKLPIIVIVPIIFSFLVAPIFATNETSVSDVLGTTNTTTNTIAQQEATTTQSDNALKLNIPALTDNPSTIITFINPAKDSTASVQLDIDGKGFIDITSPYTFRALSIGKHALEFKYQDQSSATQVYDTSIIIVPRAPIIDAPVINTDTVAISGTGLASSEILILLSSGSTVLTQNTTADGDGKWTISFNRKDLTEGIYSLNAYTRRYGYASNLSETTKFTLGDHNAATFSKNTPFNINQITWQMVKDWVITNQYYIIVAICSLILGIFLGILSGLHKKQKNVQKVEKKVAEKFTKIEPKNKEVTLREKLMGAEKPKEVESEKKEEPAVINKIDFLKDFKNFDPDNSKGEEVKPSIEVSLTSKK